ncbi:restriction endonuclease [uncultured Porphyromonas sp.]|uniref:restriction endonuclease n=1 Tax=uncultured Porphyromonas sp. TaxID=159274 RepID=UPI00258F0B8B|nr:restriction endonuclease [uncultured Porphyromonas sp.]
MKVLIEDYHYSPTDLPELNGITPIELNDGQVKLPYVGYYYDSGAEETIFILPKVFIIDKLALGKYKPELLLHINAENKQLAKEEHAFLFELSTWIYQAIALFCERHHSNEITNHRGLADVIGHQHKGDTTLLDLILALIRFGKEHQSLFTYIATIAHSGRHKIHWTKTMRTTSPVLQDGKPYYLKCKTKEKAINYDEELICLFYSTLDYLKQNYHFVVKHNLNFETERPHIIKRLIEDGKGTHRLRQIRGKYFTDELVQLWHLLYAFYERAEEAAQGKAHDERLLVGDFNIVFEDMIDSLIGEKSLPSGLKKQKDGKIIDHIYRDESLIGDGDIYFIGDSKYYKEGNSVGQHSRYKQFTYAKNVIQYHIDLIPEKAQGLRYRDELTEGYNPTPNFFIRGTLRDDLSYGEIGLKPEGKGRYDSKHFEDRLFDRDTLLVLTYEINFLYVLSSYVQNRGYAPDNTLRKQFREDVIKAFKELYCFYELWPKASAEEKKAFVKEHFKQLLGKVYQKKDGTLILALKKEGKTVIDESILGLIPDEDQCKGYPLS